MRRFVPVIVLLAVALLAFLAGRATRQQAPAVEVLRDTLTIRDTLRVEVPRIVTSYIVDTLTMEVLTVQHDTVLAYLPREEIRYEDSTYCAIVSGIRPRLDFLAVYPERQTITITERVAVPTAQRWGVGLQPGYGVAIADGRIVPSPFVGVGVSYNLFNW